jgi:hypothetical protein
MFTRHESARIYLLQWKFGQWGIKPINKKAERVCVRLFSLATTYSRGSYTTTTIGKGAFDGRVRNGNGSGHPFRVTIKVLP